MVEKMSKIVTKTNSGFSYSGFTAEEIAEAKDLAARVASEVPAKKAEFAAKYKDKSKRYHYEFGRYLSDLLIAENIPPYERRLFWKEIKDLTSGEFHDKRAGKNNAHSYLEYCYLIYQQGEELANSFTWMQWNDLLGREGSTSDRRLYIWLSGHIGSMTTEDYRFLLVLVTLFSNKYDSSELSDEQLFQHYDSLLSIVDFWKAFYKEFFHSSKQELSSARRERFHFYKRKYGAEALQKTDRASQADYQKICREIFVANYVDIDTSENLKGH